MKMELRIGTTDKEVSETELMDAISEKWILEFGKLRDDSVERDGYFVLGFIADVIKEMKLK